MNTKNEPEKGGILLELLVYVLLVVSFAAGAARVHDALGHRFRAIWQHRNAAIRQIRGPFAAHSS